MRAKADIRKPQDVPEPHRRRQREVLAYSAQPRIDVAPRYHRRHQRFAVTPTAMTVTCAVGHLSTLKTVTLPFCASTWTKTVTNYGPRR